MKNLKKIFALLLALTLVIATGMTALAEDASEESSAAELSDGKAGTWEEQDTPITQNKTVILKKDLIVFNADGSTVYAPVFEYTYTVIPATVNDMTVTDNGADHAESAAVKVPVQAGITTGLIVNNAETAGNSTSAVGTLRFTNETTWTSASDGSTNTYDIALDFSNVVFTQPGVYRYQIDETIPSGKTYANYALVDGGSNTRYLDVYVDGNLQIYGYVCMAGNTSVTSDTPKTNGFVDAGANSGADSYYTYNLTISKDVVGDTYAETTHAFPFTVVFSSEDLDATFKITETAESGSTGINPQAGQPAWSGVATIKDGKNITYTGIPCGASVAVYETNDLTGVTYAVTTKVNDTTYIDPSVTWTTGTVDGSAQTEKKDYESTSQTITTSVGTSASSQTFAVTNTLLLISPTGVVLRVAPYALILVAGMALLLVCRRRRVRDEE